MMHYYHLEILLGLWTNVFQGSIEVMLQRNLSVGTHWKVYIVLCRSKPYNLQLHNCYCMTQTNKKDQIIVGFCQYTCRRSHNGYITANTSSEINMLINVWEVQGQLCGSCMPGYAPPVYSYYLSCVNCTTSN